MKSELDAILRAAGRMVLDYSDPRVMVKEGHANFVTEADVAVQSFLLETLAKQYPHASFLAEEQESHRMGDGLTFVIDPIDGTANFMRRRRASVISIGAVEGGKVAFSAVYNPYADELFHAVRGQGAWCNGECIHAADTPAESALIGVGSSPYDPEYVDVTARTVAAVMRTFGDIRRSGSAAMDGCHIAMGRLDGTFEWNLRPWDFCACSLIAEEAGARCGHILGGEITYAEPIPYMCATARIYDAMQEMLLRTLRG
ncbi:MAG: inositol monophosphatase [Clostridia bacterium]|nr:inositol monophosphatase [Clostridia bacterium]